MASRVVAMMSVAATPPGGTMKSPALTAVPALVVTRMRPEPVAAGTANASCVVVTDDTRAGLWFSFTVVAPAAGLKFVPSTFTVVPGRPADGVNPAMVGIPAAATTKSCALMAVLAATVTVTLPVVAPAGTATVSAVGDALTTTAATPLNATALSTGVALNPVPVIAMMAPTGPVAGTNPVSVIGAGLMR